MFDIKLQIVCAQTKIPTVLNPLITSHTLKARALRFQPLKTTR
jgi:hypothetical protein